MKKFFLTISLILFSFTIFSCLDDDDDDVNRISISASPIDSIEIGQVNAIGTPTEIKLYYTLSSSCEDYYGINWQRVVNERTVTLFTFEPQNVEFCTTEALVESRTIDFNPLEPGTYTFRFWHGLDQDENNVYLNDTIVIE